jgi:hypothetical protein
MAKESKVDFADFSAGLVVGVDPTKAPIGSAREMVNMMVSDKKGITRRPGTELLGTYNSGALTCGLYNFVQSFGAEEIPVKAYGTVTEYYHPDLADWQRLESGFTSGKDWGWKEHLVNTENEDYLYGCNRYEDYRRWSGAFTQLNGALVGGETTITVDDDDVLKSEVFFSGTAASCTTTTIDVTATAAGPWTADQWNTFYVKITSGSESGKIALISDGTATQITFATIAGLSGTPTFEIRLAKFPASGVLVIGTNEVTYTAIPTAQTFTVASAPASADNSAVTLKPTAYAAAPKGNALENYLARMVVGNVRSGLSRDGSGNLQGSQSSGSYYLSKLKDAKDFTFSATRVAGEGDVVSTPYGGGDITDVVAQEEGFTVFKADYIEDVTYSQDANDFPVRKPLKQGIGAQGRVIKGKDDVYFVTNRKEITSLGRVKNVDSTPQTLNIGLKVKRLLDALEFDQHRGIEFKDRLLFGCRDSESTKNSRTLVYNRDSKSFEGMWLIPAWGFMRYGGDCYYVDSVTPNVHKMFTGVNDVQGETVFGFSSSWKSNWMNLAPSKFDLQGVSSYSAEGYIQGDSQITFSLFSDFSTEADLEFTFTAGESGLIDEGNFGQFLGADPLGMSFEGELSEPDEEGLQHYLFTLYFPDIYATNFSLGVSGEGTYQTWEVTRLSLGLLADPLQETSRVKSS